MFQPKKKHWLLQIVMLGQNNTYRSILFSPEWQNTHTHAISPAAQHLNTQTRQEQHEVHPEQLQPLSDPAAETQTRISGSNAPVSEVPAAVPTLVAGAVATTADSGSTSTSDSASPLRLDTLPIDPQEHVIPVTSLPASTTTPSASTDTSSSGAGEPAASNAATSIVSDIKSSQSASLATSNAAAIVPPITEPHTSKQAEPNLNTAMFPVQSDADTPTTPSQQDTTHPTLDLDFDEAPSYSADPDLAHYWVSGIDGSYPKLAPHRLSRYYSIGKTAMFVGDIMVPGNAKKAFDACNFNKEIIFMCTDVGDIWFEFVFSQIMMMRERGYSHIIVYMDKKEHCELFQSYMPNVCCIYSSIFLLDQELHYYWGPLFRLWTIRWMVVAKALQLGYNMLHVDNDVMFTQDVYRCEPMKIVDPQYWVS